MAFVFVSNVTLHAQAVQVKNVSFEQEDDRIVVKYDLVGKPGKKYTVTLRGSDNSGRTYGIDPSAVTGDVGKDITSGYEKKIIWRLTADYPQGLEGERFVFKVDAVAIKGKRKWPWIVGGVVAGVVVYLIVKPPKETKGSAVIRMPDNF